jgi:hypothetical protein
MSERGAGELLTRMGGDAASRDRVLEAADPQSRPAVAQESDCDLTAADLGDCAAQLGDARLESLSGGGTRAAAAWRAATRSGGARLHSQGCAGLPSRHLACSRLGVSRSAVTAGVRRLASGVCVR